MNAPPGRVKMNASKSVQEPGRRHLRVGDQGCDDARSLVQLVVGGVVAEHCDLLDLCCEDRGVVVLGVAGEHCRVGRTCDESRELDVLVRVRQGDVVEDGVAAAGGGDVECGAVAGELGGAGGACDQVEGGLSVAVGAQACGGAFELADVAAAVCGGPEDAGDVEVVDLLVCSDGVGEVAVQEDGAARERAHLRRRAGAQGRVERAARPREQERVEVRQEPGRRHLRVGDQGRDDARSLVQLLVARVVAEHSDVRQLCGEDRGVVVLRVAGEHRRRRRAADEGGELDVLVGVRERDILEHRMAETGVGDVDCRGVTRELGCAGGTRDQVEGRLPIPVRRQTGGRAFELADVAAAVLGGPKHARDVEVADLLIRSDAVGEVAVQEHCPARERTRLCRRARAQRRVEGAARPREDEHVEAVEETWRRHLRVGDEGDGVPSRDERLVRLIVAQHGNIGCLCRGRQQNARRQDADYRQVRPPHFALSR